MLTATLLLFGSVLLVLAWAERPMRKLPIAPAPVYLLVGAAAALFGEAPGAAVLQRHASELTVGTELAVLVSLVAVGLRLRVPPRLGAWRLALMLAGPGMVFTVLIGAAVAIGLLSMAWPLALLLAAVLAPTDPVLASEVRIRSEQDRDAVRLSLTAEGGLNDASALPAVMLALGLLGLHEAGPQPAQWLRSWWLQDLLWPILGGALIGLALGRGVGLLVRWSLQQGDPFVRDELLFVALVALSFGVARMTQTSTFIVAFATGTALLWPFAERDLDLGGKALADRLHAFAARIERLIEAATVLAVGYVLVGLMPGWRDVAYGLLLLLAVRPLAVWGTLGLDRWAPGQAKPIHSHQRRLLAWFGIRGIGTLFYAAFALEHGVSGGAALELLRPALATVALSIVLHGMSATPLMSTYQQWRTGRRGSA